MKRNGLNPKQQRFAEEYLVDFNASAAARRAGYSEKTAGSQGHDLLKKPEIQQAIGEAREAMAERTGITVANVIERLNSIAETCSDESSEHYNPQAANRALELIGKHLGAFTDRVQHLGIPSPIHVPVDPGILMEGHELSATGSNGAQSEH